MTLHPCGRLGDGRLLFLDPSGTVTAKRKHYYEPMTGIGPLREGNLDGPLRPSDFCDCPVGREALRWYLEGLDALHEILVILAEEGDCLACEAGVTRFFGYHTPDGDVCFMMGRPPSKVR